MAPHLRDHRRALSYFNFFVLIAQLFQKVPPLKALAPTQLEPPFLVAQTCALVLFIVLGIYSVKGFRSEQLQHAARSSLLPR